MRESTPSCAASASGRVRRYVRNFEEHEQAPLQIAAGKKKRYFGLLLKRSEVHPRTFVFEGKEIVRNEVVYRPELLLTPYMTAHAHATMITRAQKNNWKNITTLWLGEVELENEITSHGNGLRLRIANETSGEWARWLTLQRGEALPPGDSCHLPEGLKHANSINHLRDFLSEKFPRWLETQTDWRPHRLDSTTLHLDTGLDQLSAYFKEERRKSGSAVKLGNVNHDIRTPAGSIVSAITLISMSNTADEKDLDIIFEMLLRNRWVVASYMEIMLREYPNDKLLASALRTLHQIEPYQEIRRSRIFTLTELNELVHLKEVIEFVSEADIGAIQHIDYSAAR